MCIATGMSCFSLRPQKGIIFFIVLLLSNSEARKEKHSNLSAEDHESQVAVRAVFLNCGSEDSNSDGDVEVKRFEREEMYRHGQLQDCRKKIAFTIKLPSHPGKHGGEEYIPIEHVFDGSNKQRVRILDPYILRIQRDAPVQAYTLQLIDTIKGVLTRKSGKIKEKYKDQEKKRPQRDTENNMESEQWPKNKQPDEDIVKLQVMSTEDLCSWKYVTPDNITKTGPCVTSSTTVNGTLQSTIKNAGEHSSKDLDRVKRDTCSNNFLSWRRRKRNEHNVIIEGNTDEDKMPIWMAKDQADEQTYREVNDLEQTTSSFVDMPAANCADNNEQSKDANSNHKRESEFYSIDESSFQKQKDINNIHIEQGKGKSQRGSKQKKSDIIPFDDAEKEYTLYGIRDPQFWHSVNVQLFEKTTNEDGKTVWNDITRGDTASVGPLSPIWKGPDLIVKYRSLEWLNRDEFTLPKKPHCLLVPVNSNSYSEKGDSEDIKNDSQYIIVPQEDILGAESILRRRNTSDDFGVDSIDEPLPDDPINEDKPQSNRRVIVRVSQALLSGDHEPMDVVMKNSKPYLTLAHRQKHRAQIDLEAVADDNQLVRVGEFGRLTMVVSDSTRRARTVLTVQATNTGLAAARFRVIASDCEPELSELLTESGTKAVVSGSVLLPPRHTRNIKLELPVELPADSTRCSVALLNHKDEAVAMREVAIKKDDRCFCVWHCDCVCLSDDSKLLCRAMPEPRLVAAGLTREDRLRRQRDSPCLETEWEAQCDHESVACTMFLVGGVFAGLLIIGFAKAMVGLFHREVALWGLDKLVKLPRPIPKYQEVWLKNREVVYDAEGWPVNPDDTSHRVAFMPLMSMLYLNITLFVTLPCVLMRDAIKKMLFCVCKSGTSRKKREIETSDKQSETDLSKKRKRRSTSKSSVQANVQGWMSPDAGQLSEDLLNDVIRSDDRYAYDEGDDDEGHDDGGRVDAKVGDDDVMQPLLIKSFGPNVHTELITSATGDDSELDDTEYVMTQMQKSRESLSKLQGRQNASPYSDETQDKTSSRRSKR